MGAASALRGEIPFPEAGEGIFVRFKAADHLALQHKYGDEWFLQSKERLDRFDIEFLIFALQVGGKKNGEAHPISIDDLDVPLADVSLKVLDALYVSIYGKTFVDYVSGLLESRAERENKDGSPSLQSPEASLSTSGTQPSGPASSRMSSGTSRRSKS